MLGLLSATKASVFSRTKKMPFATQIPTAWQQRILLFLFFSFIAASLLAPIATDKFIPNLADYINHLAAIMQAKMALTEGQFPLRIAPLEQSGWRYPFFQFYSPTTYTFAGAIYLWLTPSNPLIAYTLTLWCGLVTGGLFMYRLAYWFNQSHFAAILAGVVYVYAPYYIIIINHLGSINEIVALGLLPAALYYALQRYYFPERSDILAKMGLVWYLLITTHIVTFIYTSLFLAILLLLITYKNRRHWRSLISVGIGYAFGCLLAMWFLAPIAQLAKYFLLSDTYSNGDYLNYFHPLLSHLLFSAASTTIGFQSALFTIHPSVGWPILLAVGLCCYGVLTQQSSGNRRADYWMPSLLILFFIGFVMVWSPFDFWKWMPTPLLVAQHSWRILGQVIWIGALLFAWAFCWLFKNQIDLKHVVVGVLLIALSANAWFPKSENAKMSLENFIRHPSLIYNQYSYMLDFEKHRHLAQIVDNVLLDPTYSLKINKPYIISKELIDRTVKPFISVRGQLPDKFANTNLQLIAEVNQYPVVTKTLNRGHFEWNIPLLAPSDFAKNQKSLSVVFKIKKTANQKIPAKLDIPIDSITLNGFLQPQETLNVDQMKPYCHQQQNITQCAANIPAQIKLLELPVLYYPGLLTVMLNGKSVTYQSVVYQGHLMTGVIPQSGINKIQVKFTGLQWANQASWGAWFIWLFLVLQITMLSFRRLK